jgi:hypothetical protein
MPTLGKWRRPALTIVVTIAALQVGVSLLVRTRLVHGYLITHLERAFGRPVEVREFGVRIFPNLQMDAHGITVGEDPSFGYEYFLRAERLSAGLRWMGVLRGQFEFGTLSLSKPSLILVRNQEGRWNLERWLPPAKSSPSQLARVYGPAQAPAPTNHLEAIEFDEGRINFKNEKDKLPFAFTNVSGNLEQVTPGRWRLQLEAQPWRSGVALQSSGTIGVQGDIAGTSARLQPAEITVKWSQASLADIFRLLRGQDYGVRGVFAMEFRAKSGVSAGHAAGEVLPRKEGESPGDWTFALEARAREIHRWDRTERTDNPSVNVGLKGRWNVVAGSLTAERVNIEAPRSNLRGTGTLASGVSPSMALQVDSAGIQAADLLAWYRAFHPDVAEGVTAEQFFTGGMTLHGWPLTLEAAAFSSRGGVIRIPGLSKALRVGEVRGGRGRMKFAVEPVRISMGIENRPDLPAGKIRPAVPRKRASEEAVGVVVLALTHDFATHAGGLSVDGRVEKTEDVLKALAALGRSVNHGWELAGAASAALVWGWKSAPWQGQWSGYLGVSKAKLQAAGLNQPIKLDDARLEWREGRRTVQITKTQGFGANWSGEIFEANASEADSEAAWKFKLHADHLDATELDRWVGPRARPSWLERLLASLLGGAAPSAPASELLRRLNASGELRVDELTVERVKLAQVRAEGTLRDLQAEVRDAEAQWAGGKVHLTMSAKFSPTPVYDVAGELDRVNLPQCPVPERIAERLGGLASGRVHLTTGGVGRDELLDRLAGSGDLKLKNVELRGWDLTASVADGAARTGISRWAVGEGVFALKDRSFLLEDLRLDDANERTVVNGTISFGRDANLAIETSSAGKRPSRTKGANHVLKISGPLDGPQLSVGKASIREPAD